jgi:hypothetical protein
MLTSKAVSAACAGLVVIDGAYVNIVNPMFFGISTAERTVPAYSSDFGVDHPLQVKAYTKQVIPRFMLLHSASASSLEKSMYRIHV